ncbi:MAG: SPOR domain-containing protein [Polyangiales bacterium]
MQVLTTTSPLRAREAARAIDVAGRGAHGFIEVGGFPASNPTAHVLTACGVHRVVVGAFLDREEAAALAASLGSGAWVRTL